MAMNEEKFQEIIEGIGREIAPLTQVNLSNRFILGGGGLSAEQLDQLCETLQQPNHLRTLNLSGNMSLSGLGKMNVFFNALESEHCKLKHLNLTRCGIHNTGAKMLSTALQHVNCPVTHLSMAFNGIGNEGVQSFSRALESEHCKLKHLSLKSCEFQGEAVQSLSTALQSEHCTLTHLNLEWCSIQDTGAKSISTALQSENCPLRYLNLDRNNIKKEGIHSILTAVKSENCKLTEINIGFNTLFDTPASDFRKALQGNYAIVEMGVPHFSNINALLTRNRNIAPSIVEDLTQLFKGNQSKFLASTPQQRLIANKHHPEVPVRILTNFIKNNVTQGEDGADNSAEIKSFLNDVVGKSKHGARLIMMASIAHANPDTKDLLEDIKQKDPKVSAILTSCLSRVGLKEYFHLTGVSKVSANDTEPTKASSLNTQATLLDIADSPDMSKLVVDYIGEIPNPVTKVREQDSHQEMKDSGKEGEGR